MKLDKDYIGNCILLRRTNGDTSSFGFVNNFLDTAAVKTWCGSGATDTCFVRLWYDQSGGGYNAEQIINANQPKLLTAGVLNKVKGLAAINFDGANDRLVTSTLGNYSNVISTFCVYQFASGGGTFSYVYDQGNQSCILYLPTTTMSIYSNADLGSFVRILGDTYLSYVLYNTSITETYVS